MIGNISKSKGFKGDTGPIGPHGPQGIQGEKGDTPAIVLRYEQDTGNLYYNSDGILLDKEYVESQNFATKEYVDNAVANGGGGSINTDEVIEIIETEHIKHRTHYAETTLLLEHTTTESGEEELELSKELDFNKLKAYVNGKYTIPKTEKNSEGAILVELYDAETDEWMADFYYSKDTWFHDSPVISFVAYNYEGYHIQLYEENVVHLDEKYLPDSVPTKINYDDVLLCEYTYKDKDFAVEYENPEIALRRIPNGDKLKFYVNGEQIPIKIYRSQYLYDDYYAYANIDGNEVLYFWYFAERNSISFYPNYQEGTVVQIREDGISAIEDKDIPESIARASYIDAKLSALQEIVDLLYAKSLTKTVSIDLLASSWVKDSDNQYSQAISIDDITPFSKVDLQPSAEQLAIFYEKDISFVTENDEGVVTVYCIGQKPANDYIVQATITEVETNG